MTAFWAKYGKTITVVTGALVTVFASHYGQHWWWPAITGALTAAGVYYAPANKDKGTPLDAGSAGAGLS